MNSSPAPKLITPSSKPNRAKKVLHIIGWTVLAIIVGVVIWIGVTGVLAFKHITVANNNKNPLSLLQGLLKPTDVQTEGDSRINILLTGIGGPGHDGANLTDTLEVMSLDPINKTMTLLSIPRDLYVTEPDGTKGKINAINEQGAAYCKKNTCAVGTDQGGDAMEGEIGQLMGIKINYFVRMDFEAFRELVDTLGGIQVNVPTALYDPLYPNDATNGYLTISFKPGLQTMNGTQALEYARSRETTSDFDRSKRQQLIISAIQSKALTLNILSNPVKVTSILNILGSNVKTDIPASQMSTLLNLIRSINSSKTTTAVLDTSPGSPLMDSEDKFAGYIITPRAGLNNFSGVQAFVAGALKDPYVIKEAATISLINASGRPSEGQTIATTLTNLGYNVVSITNAATTQTSSTVTNDTQKPYTSQLLLNRFNASFAAQSANASGANIVLTVGSRYLVSSN